MPVLAPDGTAARNRPSVVVMSHSTVGLPRESKICRRAHSVSHMRVRLGGDPTHLASMDGGNLGHLKIGGKRCRRCSGQRVEMHSSCRIRVNTLGV